MKLPISADVLSSPRPDHAWNDDWDDWEEVLGLPDDAELEPFETLSEDQESRVAAALCEWIYARLGPHAGTAELNRAFLDALWARLGSGLDVDLERRGSAGHGPVDGVLRLMRELVRTAGDWAYSTPGLVRLARLVTPREHAPVLERWLERLISSPPEPPLTEVGDSNPFVFVTAPPAADGFDMAAYDEFLLRDEGTEGGLVAFVRTLFPLDHPKGLCHVGLKRFYIAATPTCERTFFAEVEAFALTSEGDLLEGAEATLRACLEPRGTSVSEAIAHAKTTLESYATETRDVIESISDPEEVDLQGGWLAWW